MTKGRIPADNPTSAIFDLADQMSSNYEKIKYLKYYAYIFIGIALILLILLLISLIAQGNFGLVIIIIALIISGIMLLRLVIFTKNFLDDFDTNFRAIRMVRDIDPLPKVPAGRTLLDRFEAYLKNDDPIISSELKYGVEMVRNHNIVNTRWSLCILRQPRTFGPKGHLTLVRVIKREPKMADFIQLERALEHVAQQFMVPHRVIMLAQAGHGYDGISEDLYTYLTEKEHFIIKNGARFGIKLQLFVEHNKRYEIIPLIP